MATPSRVYERSDVAALAQSISAITDNSIEQLVRVDDLGRELNFAPASGLFQEILSLFGKCSETDFSVLPLRKVTELQHEVNQLISALNPIKNFSTTKSNNPTQMRNDLIGNLQNTFDKCFEVFAPAIAYSRTQTLPLSNAIQQAEEIVAELRMELDRQKNAAGDAEQTAAKLRQAAEEIGIAQHAKHFDFEAKDHARVAGYWLAVTCCIAAATLGWGWLSFRHLSKVTEIAQSAADSGKLAALLPSGYLIQMAVSRLIIFSVLLSAVVWCGRMYRAHRHNCVVNRHRQNALSTFEAFVKATTDEQTKNAVLLQATQCIFSQQNSGYISQENEPDGNAKVLEIVRGVTGRDK